MDRSLPEDEQDVIREVLASNEAQLLSYHKLRSRKAGSDRHVDLHMVVHRDLSVAQAHDLCDVIEKQLSTKLGSVTVNLHVEPCIGECQVCEPDPGSAHEARTL